MIRRAIICAVVSLALFSAARWFLRGDAPSSPLLDVAIPLAEHGEFTETFDVPDAERYGVGLWFQKPGAKLLDPITMSWTLSRGAAVIAEGSKDKLYTSRGDVVGCELWSGTSIPGPHSLRLDVSGVSQQLASSGPRLIIDLHDQAVGAPLSLVISAVAKLAGTLVGVASIGFLVAWGIGRRHSSA